LTQLQLILQLLTPRQLLNKLKASQNREAFLFNLKDPICRQSGSYFPAFHTPELPF
jgi:hypothetical protein